MKIVLPITVSHIIKTITDNGYSCEIVGGAVRDLLLGIPTHDWDFATNATPEQIMPLFQESFYENTFGTVMVAQKHLNKQFTITESESQADDLIYDITTYRSDGEYRNHRKPEEVTWGENIEEDLKRRDFTINAMAMRSNGEIIDPFEGQKDLENKIIRTVGNPAERLEEDALRMLRAIRFAVQLGFQIETETGEVIKSKSEQLSHVSWERIGDEITKMLASNAPDIAIHHLDYYGLLAYIMPELIATKGVRQSGHHIYDVWEHSLRALQTCPSTDPIVRLATLLHDIAKPETAKVSDKGTITFYNHEVVGARIAKRIAERLRFSKKNCDRIFGLVRWHMFTYEKHVTDAYIRRFIRRVGEENLDDIMALRTGDRIGSGSKATSWRLEELQQRIYDQLHQPLKLTDMAVDGNDIMAELKIKSGPIIGKILNQLFKDVLENPEHNTKEYLLEQIKNSELK